MSIRWCGYYIIDKARCDALEKYFILFRYSKIIPIFLGFPFVDQKSGSLKRGLKHIWMRWVERRDILRKMLNFYFLEIVKIEMRGEN